MPYAHLLIALKSIQKGLSKLILNKEKLDADIQSNWSVLAEAIQTILRREHYPDPYNALKMLTRGQQTLTRESLHAFIDQLAISSSVKEEMLKLTPEEYVGVHPPFMNTLQK